MWAREEAKSEVTKPVTRSWSINTLALVPQRLKLVRVFLCLYSSQAHQYRNRELGADKLLLRGYIGKSSQVSGIEVSVPPGGKVYCLVSATDSNTNPEKNSPPGRWADKCAGIQVGCRKNNKHLDSGKSSREENTGIKITRHQRCPCTHANQTQSVQNTSFNVCAGNNIT